MRVGGAFAFQLDSQLGAKLKALRSRSAELQLRRPSSEPSTCVAPGRRVTVGHMKRTTTTLRHDAKMRRAAERAERAALDPWFGKRRPAGEMGRNKTRAAANKRACRGKNWD